MSGKTIPFRIRSHTAGFPARREGISISEQNRENVILFPKTIDYYQIELTRLLETERYGEAIGLLRFLSSVDSGDERTNEEWRALLEWLQTLEPAETGEAGRAASIAEEEEEDISEDVLRKRHFAERSRTDAEYAGKLLDMLDREPSLAKQALALEQLSMLEDEGVARALRAWLAKTPLPSMIQFKVLQILKQRGEEGSVSFPRMGEEVTVDIQDTPASFDEFPDVLGEVLDRIVRASEIKQPTLAYFARQTWHEFLAAVYGTSFYRQLAAMEPEHVDAWAAAFQLFLERATFGTASEDEALEQYGITEELRFVWQRASERLEEFMKKEFPGR
ncbi:hypothetical protein J31TS4_24440 [Paenibacillus sp. J31TS4]|uniref:hypothetical protein n=1 Tax=Paenibacillus sp. J31TS4 TaxID=2807195 RepID=UPI001B2B4DF5|nr:hypothetical protein [Paenibacillus sp. J31TS4]GIP39164.1 hypothetical protein J31TS4_24440 [Paenibacillus sp. J31TS4]